VGVGCRINPFEPIECGYGAPEGATLQLQCFYWHGDPLRPNGNTVLWRVTFGSKDVFIADTRARLTPNVAWVATDVRDSSGDTPAARL
jgi:hypothetical protein